MSRIIGIVNGVVEVEKLDTDSDDFYDGICAGVEAAIEVYGKKPQFNCVFNPLTGSCDKSKPCFGCCCTPNGLEEPSDDYFKGYDIGYDLGISYVAEEEERRLKICEEAERKAETLKEAFEVYRSIDDLWEEIEKEDEDEDFSEGLEYARGHSVGYDLGYEYGYEQGVADALDDEIILDGEFLDLAYNLRDAIRGLLLDDFETVEDLRSHNFRVYDTQHALLNLVEWWAMDKVYAYWNKKTEEE